MNRIITTLALAVLSAPAVAQSTLSVTRKFAWSENTGWMNWRDAGSPAGSNGVAIEPDILRGFIWAENIGWINTGDGTPANGVSYQNFTGTDFGVNRLPSGDLVGLAWGENIGWINFDTAAALAADGKQARYDARARRFRGYAWGENIGWISLDDTEYFVGNGCGPADLNHDDLLDFFDVLAFLSAFAAFDIEGDFNNDALWDFFDVLAFLNAFSQGCP